jgi:hypothetical protein
MDEWKDEEQEEEVSSLMYINQHSILIIARQPIPAQEFSGAVFGSGCVLSTTSSRDDQASIAPEDESG